VLRGQPPGFPSNNGTIPVGTITRPAANGRLRVILRQAIHSHFARVAGVFRRKNSSSTWPSSSPAGRSLMGPIAVVGLVISKEDRRLLTEICSRNRWRLLFADTCEEAWTALDTLKAPVILYDRDLPGKGWRQSVEDLASSPHRACIILVSAVLDTYLRDEVVRHGGYDVLSKPLREDDVVRTVRLALTYWYSAMRTIADLFQES